MEEWARELQRVEDLVLEANRRGDDRAQSAAREALHAFEVLFPKHAELMIAFRAALERDASKREFAQRR